MKNSATKGKRVGYGWLYNQHALWRLGVFNLAPIDVEEWEPQDTSEEPEPYTPYIPGQYVSYASSYYRCIHNTEFVGTFPPPSAPFHWSFIDFNPFDEGTNLAIGEGSHLIIGGNYYVVTQIARTPSPEQWNLFKNKIRLGLTQIGFGDEGGVLKADLNEWLPPDSSPPYGDILNFSSLPAGERQGVGWDDFMYKGSRCWFWTNTANPATLYYLRNSNNNFNVASNMPKNMGASVRFCQKVRPTYGVGYSWNTISSPKGISPPGFRVASIADWNDLLDSIEGTEKTNKLKSKRQINTPLDEYGGVKGHRGIWGRSFWPWNQQNHPRWNENEEHWGEDTLKFSAFPAGYRSHLSETPSTPTGIGETAVWWVSDEFSEASGKMVQIDFDSGNLIESFAFKQDLLPIRCVRDATPYEKTLPDGSYRYGIRRVYFFSDESWNGANREEEEIYDTVKIGNLVWLCQNLNRKVFNDDDPIPYVSWSGGVHIYWPQAGEISDPDTHGYRPFTPEKEPLGMYGIFVDNNNGEHLWVSSGDRYDLSSMGEERRFFLHNSVEDKYLCGEEIPYVSSKSQWDNLTTGARCAYNNDSYLVAPPNVGLSDVYEKLSGTVQISGTIYVSGSATSFNTDFVVGDMVKILDEVRTIVHINSNTLITVDSPWTQSGSGLEYKKRIF